MSSAMNSEMTSENESPAIAPVINAVDVKKTFSEGSVTVPVLKGVDLKVERGERIAIMGSSGSGKSTLLHLLGGLDDLTEGQIFVDGKECSRLNAYELGRLRNTKLGFVYQFHHLLPEFTALENVMMPLLISGSDIKSAAAEAERILDKVGLGHRLQHKPAELSGGERQRTAISRALVNKPLCVLADEPTGNLDHNTAMGIYDIFMELNQDYDCAIIMVTHDIELARRFSTVKILEDGLLREFN